MFARVAVAITHIYDSYPFIDKSMSRTAIAKGFCKLLSVLLEGGTHRYVFHGAMLYGLF
ncbi:hypothetical protein [Moraxella lacunata]|uniref:hypothetical protein n=1 Tax=Moraxella lacunata TaxID=477 RepID=UPI003EE37BA6